MSRRVKVKSIDVVEQVLAAMRSFQEEAAAAITDLQLEVNRALDWIHNDRRNHWTHELRRRWDRVGQAKNELEQARTFRRVAEHQPACREERKALALAKQRLRVAEEKAEAVRHWIRMIDRAVIDYRGNMAPFARWLELDMPQALASLQQIARSLESYMALQAPEAPSPPPPGKAPADEQDDSPDESEAEAESAEPNATEDPTASEEEDPTAGEDNEEPAR